VKVEARRSARRRSSGGRQSWQAHGGQNLLDGGLRFDKGDKAEVAFAICALASALARKGRGVLGGNATINTRSRLGGTLNFYHRAAA
jgi:hypothetical protein